MLHILIAPLILIHPLQHQQPSSTQSWLALSRTDTTDFSEECLFMLMPTATEVSAYRDRFNLTALLETKGAWQTEPEWLNMCIPLLQRCALDAKPRPTYTITGKRDHSMRAFTGKDFPAMGGINTDQRIDCLLDL